MSKQEYKLAALLFLILGVFFTLLAIFDFKSKGSIKYDGLQSIRLLTIGVTSLIASVGIRILASRTKRNEGK